MKSIKSTLFSLLVLFVSTSLLLNCSKDETKKSGTVNAKVSNYLKSFYATNYQLGKSIITKVKKENSSLSKSTEIDNLIVTEVFVGDDTRARGYVITDKSTNEFLFFVDVDRIEFKLTSVKIDTNDTKIFNNIEELDKYISTNEFDLIKIAEQVNSGIIQGRKFWGSNVSWGGCGPNTDGTAGCFQGEYSTYSVFWIEIGGSHPTGNTRPCDC